MTSENTQGPPPEALQQQIDKDPRTSFHEAHVGRSPEALQDELRRSQRGQGEDPVDARDAESPSRVEGEGRVAPETQDDDETQDSVTAAALRARGELDAEPDEDESAPLSEKEEKDPGLLSLEALPDDELRKLCDENNVRCQSNWGREVILRRLKEAGVKGPKLPELPDETEDAGE